jgi:polyisoprenoid-binding protein YceI
MAVSARCGDRALVVERMTAPASASRREVAMPASADVAPVDSAPPGTATIVTVKGTELALVNVNGTFDAVDNECTHVGGYLGEGEINPDWGDWAIECPCTPACSTCGPAKC